LGVVASPGHVDRVTVLAETTEEEAGHLDLVLDDEDAHVRILAVEMRVR
jgi:hypothetical protein